MKNPLVSNEKRKDSFKIGKTYANALAGFICGFIIGSIVFIPLMFIVCKQ